MVALASGRPASAKAIKKLLALVRTLRMARLIRLSRVGRMHPCLPAMQVQVLVCGTSRQSASCQHVHIVSLSHLQASFL